MSIFNNGEIEVSPDSRQLPKYALSRSGCRIFLSSMSRLKGKLTILTTEATAYVQEKNLRLTKGGLFASDISSLSEGLH